MAKTIVDAILGLNFDDPPCSFAAAALFYALTNDVSSGAFVYNFKNLSRMVNKVIKF